MRIAEQIKSLQHPLVKHLVKLRDKEKYRAQCDTALISGIKLIAELSVSHTFKTVLIDKHYSPPFVIHAERLFHVDEAILKKVTGLVHPEPLAAEIPMPQEQDLQHARLLLILDGISDPGNMGTLLRTALALGWEGVAITSASTDPFNDKALRAAKGATFKIPFKKIPTEHLDAFLSSCKWQLLAADMHGEPIGKIQVKPPLALALGNEARGLSEKVKEKAKCIAIPMHEGMSSLNVACAGAILMHVLGRRHG